MNVIRFFLRRLKRLVLLALNLGYDGWRYHVHSAKSGVPGTDEQLPAQLIVQYHAIEKGLALKDTRPGFGLEHLREIFGLLDEWRQRQLPESHLAFQGALGAVEDYLRFHRERNHAVEEVESKFRKFESSLRGSEAGGVVRVNRDALRQAARGGFEELALSRHSVRQFSGEPVDADWIRRAVRIAQRTPSACNRQSGRVYAIWDPAKKLAVLKCQSGNRGFREEIEVVLVVTADLGDFCDPKERNQCYVDGGMFAMSLLYALHFLGLGACALNWSVTLEQDRALRRVLSIRPSENVIMLIGAGHLREEFRVARSERKPIEEVLVVL